MVLSLLTLVLWAGGCAHRGVLKLGWSPLYWPALAFLALAVVQLFAGWSTDTVATREAVLKLVTNLVIFFLAGQLFNSLPEKGRALEWLGLIVTLLALALCILGLAQRFWGEGTRIIYWSFPVSGEVFGPYVNHNNYAGLMEMLLPISAAYLLSRTWNALTLFFSWCGVAMVLTSIWICGSRGGAIVLVIEGMPWVGILLWNRPRGVSPRLFAGLLGVVLISALAFSWLVSTGRVGGRAWSVFATPRSVEVTLGDRLRAGIDTFRMARSNPWKGVGVGCFESVFPSYMTFSMDRRWTHAHDDFLEAAAETGLPGVVIILVALALFFRLAFRRIERRLRQGCGWVQIGAAVGAVGLLCHSLVDFNLRIPANAAWFVVCVAIATNPGPAGEGSRKIARESSANRSGEFLT
jgi:O-antigen ligase